MASPALEMQADATPCELDEPLNCFEEYMLADDRPGWPMTVQLRVRLPEAPTIEALREAMRRTARRHPRLAARIRRDRRGRLRWASSLEEMDCAAAAAGDPRRPPFAEPLNIESGPLWRARVQSAQATPQDSADPAGGDLLWFEFHHSVCDGLGAVQVIQETLGDCGAALPSLPEAPMLPFHHPDWLPGRQRGVAAKLRQWLGIVDRSVRFFLLKPCSVDQLVELSESRTASPRELPRFLSADLGRAEPIRRAARAAGGTVNDLLLRDAFLALADLAARRRDASRRFRIFIPMNLRDKEPLQVQNVVGMVHLDAVVSAESDPRTLFRSISRSTQRFRENRLGRALLAPLEGIYRLSGSTRPLLPETRCAATVVVSNLGEISEIELPCGQAATAIEAAPPVRPLTAVTFAVTTYGDRIRLGMRYHPEQAPDEAAEYLLARFQTRVRESTQDIE